MRVLMVSSLWPPAVLGGAEQYAAALAGELRDAGHEVGVVTGVEVDDPRVVARIPSWGYPITEFASHGAARRLAFHAGDLIRPDAARILDGAIRRFRPDVVHSHVVQGMGATALTRPAHDRVGHVHTLHDYWLLCQRTSLVRRDGTACATRCTSCRVVTGIRDAAVRRRPPDVVLAVSRAVAAAHTDVLGWMRDRTRVVYNPVHGFAGPVHRTPTPDRVTFGFVGQVSRTKGVLTLVDAMRGSGLRHARLVVAGRGPALDVVAAEGPPVEARGWLDRDALEGLYAEIDCLVVPSEWPDPAPLVLNEARARGIPVIGARAGGIPELVAPDCVPLLFPAGDREALVDRLRTFAADPAAFVPRPEAAPAGWPGHLAAVTAAYREAAAATERDLG
jgi:glycosyltransferase involved in cell wall biosynthesis